MKWLEGNTEEYFYVDIGDWLVEKNIQMSDIIEAKFLVKVNRNDDDADAVVDLRIGSGILPVNTSPTRLGMYLVESDFDDGALITGKRYVMGCAIKTATTVNFMEIVISEHFIIVDSFFEDL